MKFPIKNIFFGILSSSILVIWLANPNLLILMSFTIHVFIIPTDAHCYKNHRMLKQFKIMTLAMTCFSSRRNHHQGAVLCLAKTTEYGFSVLFGIDAVNVMAAYQPVVQACSSQWRQELYNRLICRHNIDCVCTNQHRKTILCSFS